MRTIIKAGLLLTMAGAVLGASGCGGKKDTAQPDKKNAKITITVTGMSPTDYDGTLVTISAVIYGSERTAWKVNGTTRNNEPNISLNKNDLINGNTFVVESVKPLDGAVVAVSSQNFEAPFTLNLKNEINGKVMENINQSVTTTFDRTWTY